MGRDWLHWGGGGGGCSRKGRMPPEYSTGGCMCAVFHFFDLHPFQFPLNQQHHPDSIDFLKQEDNSSKGIEAPRNSLETEEAMNHEQNLNFPGGLQIKTRVSTNSTEDIYSTTSPGTTTPSLVARLMGLDMLPHCSSPSSTSTISRLQTKSCSNRRKERNVLTRRSSRSFSDDDISVGVQSLPETPRMSLGRRSDVECHRLSLNVNKENVSEEFAGGRRRGRFRQDEDRNPGNYAKQIANQVRESVSRRVGLDITNISREKEINRRDENLIPVKLPNKNHFKLSPSPEGETRTDEGKHSVRLPDIKKSKQVPNPGCRNPRIPTSCHKGVSDPLRLSNRVKNGAGITSSNMKKFHPQWPDQAIRNKKEEAFVHSAGTKKANLTDKKKSKKAPLSCELLNTSGPTLLPVKKAPSPPATKLPQKQTQASDALTSKRNAQLCSSKKIHSYKQLHLDLEHVNTAPDSNNHCGSAPAAEYRYYIQRILRRTGIIDGVTPLKLGKWHTCSHPLDPSIFYYLELFHPSAGGASAAFLSRRCNRKLIFQVVDELLAKILKPYLDFNPWGHMGVLQITSGLGLIDELCEKIEGFPAANCEVLEDIDRLIEGDLCNRQMGGGNWGEEGAKLARYIEGEIMDSLLGEMVETLGLGSPYSTQY